MDSTIFDKISLAYKQYLNAFVSGSAAFAFTDGYLSIDNFLSALLIVHNIDPTHNHPVKLKKAKEHFPFLWDSKLTILGIDAAYEIWNKVRYENYIPTADDAVNFIRLCTRVKDKVIENIAKEWHISADDLDTRIMKSVKGANTLYYEEICSEIHEARQKKCEELAEYYEGSKLGIKLTDASNFSYIDVSVEDKLTMDILKTNNEINQLISEHYNKFLDIVEKIQLARGASNIEFNEIPDFMFSLRLRYHGQTLNQISHDWGRMIADALQDRKNNDSPTNNA